MDMTCEPDAMTSPAPSFRLIGCHDAGQLVHLDGIAVMGADQVGAVLEIVKPCRRRVDRYTGLILVDVPYALHEEYRRVGIVVAGLNDDVDVLVTPGGCFDHVPHIADADPYHLGEPPIGVQEVAVSRRHRVLTVVVQIVTKKRNECLVARIALGHQVLNGARQKLLADREIVVGSGLFSPRQHAGMVIADRIDRQDIVSSVRRNIRDRYPWEIGRESSRAFLP